MGSFKNLPKNNWAGIVQIYMELRLSDIVQNSSFLK
jgi:hypothetical protein